MCNSEQNGAKSFDLGQNRNFLWIFKVAENRDSKTHYRAAEIAEKEWVECSSWRKTRASIARSELRVLWPYDQSLWGPKPCLRDVLFSAVTMFEAKRKGYCRTSPPEWSAIPESLITWPQFKRVTLAASKSQLYYRDAVLAFKCMTGQAPTYVSSPFLKRAEISGRETRNSQLLNVPLFKTTTGQRTFFYRTVSLWNSLETNLKLSESLDIFKRRLRGKLLRVFLSS